MGLLTRFASLLQKNQSHSPATPPAAPTAGSLIPQKPLGPTAPQPKTLTQLEREMAAEQQILHTRPHRASPQRRSPTLVSKLARTLFLVGVPVGMLWFVNLPYPIIRRPVARTVPILLLPSYISLDHHYRGAIASVESANQLITQATSFADIELGEQTVKQAQENLDALPIWFLYDYPDYDYWWYSWRFSRSRFDQARATIGELSAKAFQEKNAQIAFTDAEQSLTLAKQDYQHAKNLGDQKLAIASWQSALDQFAQISNQTFAGRLAEQKLEAYQREFQDTVGLAAGNQQTMALIEAAKGFAREAALASQNPPHSVVEWQRIIGLWDNAIDRLEKISIDDPIGYTEAQKKLIEYQSNLGQIRVRQEREEQSVRSLNEAKQQIQTLVTYLPENEAQINRNRLMGQLQGIINELKQVETGTTVYLEAQELLLYAQNKLNSLQP